MTSRRSYIACQADATLSDDKHHTHLPKTPGQQHLLPSQDFEIVHVHNMCQFVGG